MTEVTTNIDFMRYNPHQIIDLIEQGVVTVEEVVASKVAYSFFTNILHDYIRTYGENMEDTVILNRRKTDKTQASEEEVFTDAMYEFDNDSDEETIL